MKTSEGVPPKNRDVKFDGLRVLGLLAIILAHVNPPALLFQLRNFDVPLMVLVSGAVYGLSSSQKKYVSYIWERVLRLLTPTWIFLGIFFLVNFFLGHHFSTGDILSSFALLNGIGYVWIIRVFILVAIIAPFFVYLYRKIQNKLWYLLAVGLVFALYIGFHQIYMHVSLHSNAAVDFVSQNIIFYILPFGCVAGLGIYILRASRKSLGVLLLLFTALFIFLAMRYSIHQFMPTQAFKYPPGIYYLAYALAASLLLYFFSMSSVFQKIFGSSFMLFIAASSLWIYLWQIFFLYQWTYLQNIIPKWVNNYIGEYFVIVVVSVVITYIQKKIVTKIVSKISYHFIQNFLSLSFLK